MIAQEFHKVSRPSTYLLWAKTYRVLSEYPLQGTAVKVLAALPSLDELRGKIVGLIQAPATKIAGVVQAPAGQLARVIGAYAAKDAA